MKDGFDSSVAQKMPKIQKKRPNRPWNVDPVLLKAQEEEKREVAAPEARTEPEAALRESVSVQPEPPVEDLPAAEPEARAQEEKRDAPKARAEAKEVAAPRKDVPVQKNETIVKAVETLKELSSDFTQMIFDRKSIQQELDKSSSTMDEIARENARLKASIMDLEKGTQDGTMLEKEIVFLNEQLEDADLYIQNMVGLLEEKTETFEQEASRRKDLESRYGKISKEIQEKAKMDVKVSILERDLTISNTRILELESKLEEEYQKREPLEEEIVELKSALDKVYSSLAHIRLKAKREVYGS